jgi:two-component system CheB/CheR fusion protein
MVLQHVDRPSDYLRLLEAHRGELNALYEDLLIGVTAFFRDREPFEALCSTILPALFEKRSPEQPVRVWVPGCATGEEAYSIAMCVLEYLEDHQLAHRLQIFATDINEHALSRARHGMYPASIELDVSPERLQRFFSRADKGGYQVSRKVRDMVVFARHNLGKDPPFSRLDLVSCRNLLIYLQPALQKRVMRVFHYALNPHGCLLLGTAESVGDASDLFSLVDRKLKIYVKKHGTSPGVFDFAFGQSPERGTVSMSNPPHERKPEVSFQQAVDRKILDKYGPPGVVVDQALNILQFRGQCASYMAPSPGAATLSMLRMVRPELLVPLKSVVQRVLVDGVPASCEPVRLTDAAAPPVVMDVIPVEASPGNRCLLVLFRNVTEGQPAEQAAGEDEGAKVPGAAKRIHELERELTTTKEYLETIIQELATSNEELQSSNEELQSSNEELQSTNEELETSKEELQATNEELVTVNEELQTRIGQLGVANDDVVNLLMNVGSPVLLVGLDLRIRRFSAAAERLLNLISSDVGRPISYLGSSLNVPHIESTVSDAINSMRMREVRVRCSNGAWYTMRTVPYQNSDRAVRGGVIELLPFPLLGSNYDASELHQLTTHMLGVLPSYLVLLDAALRIVWANDAFVQAWNDGTELFGRSLDTMFDSREQAPELWKRIEDTARTGQPFGDLVLRHRWGHTGERNLRWMARSVGAEGQRRELTLLVVEEQAVV